MPGEGGGGGNSGNLWGVPGGGGGGGKGFQLARRQSGGQNKRVVQNFLERSKDFSKNKSDLPETTNYLGAQLIYSIESLD